MEFKITSFKKYNEAVTKILGYVREYDKIVDRLILDGTYYRNEIEQDDYSDEDLEAIILGNLNNYEIHLLNTVHYMFKLNHKLCKYDIDELKDDTSLSYYMINNVDRIQYKYSYQNDSLCSPNRKQNYKDRKRFDSLEELETYYKILCTFENIYKIKDS